MKTELERIKESGISICNEAIIYRKKFHSFEQAWGACHRGDWMLYIASILKIDEKLLIYTKAKCAETVKYLMKDKRSLDCLQACFDYYEGKITIKQLNDAVDAADDAVYDDVDDAAAYAAYAYAADAAYAAYGAYAYADAAAYAAADAAASYADAISAKKENQKKTAEICKKYLTDSVFEKIFKKNW